MRRSEAPRAHECRIRHIQIYDFHGKIDIFLSSRSSNALPSQAGPTEKTLCREDRFVGERPRMMNECSSWPRSNVTRTSTREAGYFDGRARLRSGVAWLALSIVCGWNACAWGAPMLDPVLAPKPDAAREALLLGRYALTVKAPPSGQITAP